uniref:Uncharacterized protein n=1 Tax=Lepeophtheirus salmonis TaxID=72036 RepID=A0A0K2U357_LEPSM
MANPAISITFQVGKEGCEKCPEVITYKVLS